MEKDARLMLFQKSKLITQVDYISLLWSRSYIEK